MFRKSHIDMRTRMRTHHVPPRIIFRPISVCFRHSRLFQLIPTKIQFLTDMKFLVFFVLVIENRELDESDKMKEIVDKIKIWAHLEQLTEGKEKKKWWEVAVTSEENKWKQINWRKKRGKQVKMRWSLIIGMGSI